MTSNSDQKATRLDFFSFGTPAMRVFHLAWMAFFVCFFAWFAVAPLMPVIKQEFRLSAEQIADINIAAVLVTIGVRLVAGPLTDKYGPRRVYTALLVLGSLPVFGIALAQGYWSFLVFRLLIGAIGASFVVTQYHTSVMFAPNVVGTANAAAAGWGNAGGGAVQSLMPWVFAALLSLGLESALGWRVAMLVPGALMLLFAWLYFRFTQDCPQGDFRDLRARGLSTPSGKKTGFDVFRSAMRNYRVWILFLTYGACFGVELFVHNVASIYYAERFSMDMKQAGMAAGAFGLLALFARALGGMTSDWLARRRGLDARTFLVFALVLAEGLGLIWFTRAPSAAWAIAAMLTFGLFTHLASGAHDALVPFVDRKALGGVAGIIGAGGNVGAVLAGVLMRQLGDVQQCFGWLALAVIACAFGALGIRFSTAHKQQEDALYAQALAARKPSSVAPKAAPASAQLSDAPLDPSAAQ
jgi:MFS transporter, NNP family, nitrate/nitrite transporter